MMRSWIATVMALAPSLVFAGESEDLVAAIQANCSRVADLSCSVTVTARTSYRAAGARFPSTSRWFRYAYQAPDKARIEYADGSVSLVNGNRAWDVSRDGSVRLRSGGSSLPDLPRIGPSELWTFAAFVVPFTVGCDGWSDGLRVLCVRVPNLAVQGVRRYDVAPASGAVQRIRFSDSRGTVFRETVLTYDGYGGARIPVRIVDTTRGPATTAVVEQIVGDVRVNEGLADNLFEP